MEVIDKPTSEVQVGDKVLYVPHVCHALNQNPLTKDYPWVFGDRAGRPRLPAYKRQDDGSDPDKPYELEGKELQRFLTEVKGSDRRDRIVFIRPKELWPATVRAVNPDGTVNLDVTSNVGGFTLHYNNVKIDREPGTPTIEKHHTCRLIYKGSSDACN